VTDHEANVRSRPTEMLIRQLQANRKAARDRDEKGRKKFPHILPYRPHFVREILWMRYELRRRRLLGDNDGR
jgi:hypothetical protein